MWPIASFRCAGELGRYGSWLCENARTLNRDRRSYSSKTVSVARQASGYNLEIELKNIILRRVSILNFYTARVISGSRIASCPRLILSQKRTSTDLTATAVAQRRDIARLAANVGRSRRWKSRSRQPSPPL